MSVVSDEVFLKLERMASIIKIISEIVVHIEPGKYKFAETFPNEYREYNAITRELCSSVVPEMSELGFRFRWLMNELEETDRTFNLYGDNPKTTRKQYDLLNQAFSSLDKTLKKIKKQMLKGVI